MWQTVLAGDKKFFKGIPLWKETSQKHDIALMFGYIEKVYSYAGMFWEIRIVQVMLIYPRTWIEPAALWLKGTCSTNWGLTDYGKMYGYIQTHLLHNQ